MSDSLLDYSDYQTTRTRYHSRDWEHLVEQGWITARVEDNPSDGSRIAVMVKLRGAP